MGGGFEIIDEMDIYSTGKCKHLVTFTYRAKKRRLCAYLSRLVDFRDLLVNMMIEKWLRFRFLTYIDCMMTSFLHIMIQNAYDKLSAMISKHEMQCPNEDKLRDTQLNVGSIFDSDEALLSLRLVIVSGAIETNPCR